jgi:hypothetical protein
MKSVLIEILFVAKRSCSGVWPFRQPPFSLLLHPVEENLNPVLGNHSHRRAQDFPRFGVIRPYWPNPPDFEEPYAKRAALTESMIAAGLRPLASLQSRESNLQRLE